MQLFLNLYYFENFLFILLILTVCSIFLLVFIFFFVFSSLYFSFCLFILFPYHLILTYWFLVIQKLFTFFLTFHLINQTKNGEKSLLVAITAGPPRVWKTKTVLFYYKFCYYFVCIFKKLHSLTFLVYLNWPQLSSVFFFGIEQQQQMRKELKTQ